MRSALVLLAVSAALAITVAACGSDDTPASTPVPTAAPTATRAPTNTPVPPTATPAPAPTTVPVVTTASFTGLGAIMTDGAGRALYIFDRDTPGVSACTGNCLNTWLVLPPGTGSLTGSSAVTARLEVITRPDGARQVTSNGMPLYYNVRDTAPGTALGAGVGGIWWTVRGDGTKVSVSLQPAPTATPVPTVAPTAGGGAARARQSIIAGFGLETFSIRAGTSVVWKNLDPDPHTASSGANSNADRRFESGVLEKDRSSAPILFATAGSFPYFCAIHTDMRGTVTVTP
ncbi:MAG: hypothetical protein EXR49_03080 [Dehalococcoidia bacterium]|nr:hypothetical protein [Dehalococcoidia bacterium]